MYDALPIPEPSLLDETVLRFPAPQDASEIAAFYRRNTTYLWAFQPIRPSLCDEGFWTAQIFGARQALAAGQECIWFLFLGETVLGKLRLHSITRGAAQTGWLTYECDPRSGGRGLMTRAAQAVLSYAEQINLHRVQAQVHPENASSRALLQRLGFAEEGLMRDALFLHGAWADQQLFTRVLSGWTCPPGHYRSGPDGPLPVS